MKTIIFDGAMGSTLNEQDLMGECNELYNITKPDIIAEIHKKYALAGAEYTKTNTFGGNPMKLAKSNNEKKVKEINLNAVRLAKESGIKIAGDIGPSGELYEPYGMVSTEDIYNSFLIQAEYLKESDMILIETMSSLVEAYLAYLAIRKISSTIPIIMSFTYSSGYTMMGCTPENIAKATNNLDIYAIGTNCGGGPQELIEVVKSYANTSCHKICAMPNAGLPELHNNIVFYPFKAERYADAMKAIVESGADIIGGCCGTTPDHIEKLTSLIQETPSRTIKCGKYIATERECLNLELAKLCGTSIEEILEIEADMQVARIDVSNIDNLREYINQINMISFVPKCFLATAEQAELIPIIYHGITDIEII